MEPAVYRREHGISRRDPLPGRIVAMEPAVYRREHTARDVTDAGGELSQWSPPFIGGSTWCLLGRDERVAVVAMEPAVYRREHLDELGDHAHQLVGRNGARRL